MKTKNIVVGLLAVVVLTFALLPDSFFKRPVKRELSEYPLSELQTFWTNHLQNTIVSILSGTHRIPEVAEQGASAWAEATKRYGGLHLGLAKKQVSVDIYFSCTIMANGVPRIEAYVPKLYEAYKALSGEPQFGKERFEVLIISSFLHELDHLIHQDFLKGYTSIEELSEIESRAWAVSCEKVLTVLVEKYHMHLPPSANIAYQEWLTADRHTNATWKKFILDQHKRGLQ